MARWCWFPAPTPDKQRRSVHYQAGGSFFATGDAFEV
jgi:hypothetical protein